MAIVCVAALTGCGGKTAGAGSSKVADASAPADAGVQSLADASDSGSSDDGAPSTAWRPVVNASTSTWSARVLRAT